VASRLNRIKEDTARLLVLVKAMAMDRPIFKPACLTKEERERQRIYELETEQLRWQYGNPEDRIDTER